MTTTYDVVCPRCASRARAAMLPSGVEGTYREPLTRYVARRISCTSCGLVQESDDASGLAIEYWFKAQYRGHTVWARNHAHREVLVRWLETRPASGGGEDVATRADLERLPRWMTEAPARYEVAALLAALRRE